MLLPIGQSQSAAIAKASKTERTFRLIISRASSCPLRDNIPHIRAAKIEPKV